MSLRKMLAALAVAGFAVAAAPAAAQSAAPSKYQAEYRLSIVVNNTFPWGKAADR